MAIITITDSENIAIENGTILPHTITIGNAASASIEVRIDGFIVDQKGVPSATIAVGNIIRGVLNGKYIIAEVQSLPYTIEENLKLFTQSI